jgi:hypothetical protein
MSQPQSSAPGTAEADSPSSPEGPPGRPLARNTTLDAVVAACVLAVGLVVVIQARKLGSGWMSDGPGPGYFPFYIGLILMISGVVILVQALRARAADGSVFVDSEQLKRVLSVLLPTAAYTALTMAIGLYVASAIFIAVFMVWLGKYSLAKSVAVGVLVNVFFFVMFEVWFKVPLYKGAWNPLAFLGY